MVVETRSHWCVCENLDRIGRLMTRSSCNCTVKRPSIQSMQLEFTFKIKTIIATVTCICTTSSILSRTRFRTINWSCTEVGNCSSSSPNISPWLCVPVVESCRHARRDSISMLKLAPSLCTTSFSSSSNSSLAIHAF